MGYLTEVVYLDTFMDDGRLHGCTVDAGVGADFDIVLDDDIAYLVHFYPVALLVGGEAKSV